MNIYFSVTFKGIVLQVSLNRNLSGHLRELNQRESTLVINIHLNIIRVEDF